MKKKKCIMCGTMLCPSERGYGAKKYCSEDCVEKARELNKPEDEPRTLMSPGTIGSWAELLICADLLKKGYAVFRSVSPSCSCDILIMKDKKIYRVEVTKGRRSLKGGIIYNIHEPSQYDILALVFWDGVINYIVHSDQVDFIAENKP